MVTRAIKPKRDDNILTNWQPMPERAPSLMREETPTTARIIAFVSLLFLTMGLLAMLVPLLRANWRYWIGPGWGFVFFTIGVGGLLYHAFVERDVQFRLVYNLLGLLLLLPILRVAATLVMMPFGQQAPLAGPFMIYGLPALLVALALLLAVARNEPRESIREFTLRLIGGAGVLLAVTGFVVGNISQDFLLGEGLLLMLLGLAYIGGFIGMQEITSPWGYRAGLGLGILGLAAFLVALLRCVGPGLMYRMGLLSLPSAETYLVPAGLVLMGMGLLYMAISVGICSDRPFVVLTRRELAAYFYSPIAYLVIFGYMLIGWYMFFGFVGTLDMYMEEGAPFYEPIVSRYMFNLIPVIGQMFVIPVLTMRLLSEERRTGTLEVLLTAPVNEVSVVLSKFLASLVFFFLTWVPWGLFLVALRVVGGEEFDYRPLLSFFIALIFTGAGFISMGLFFSAITRNQIVAAVLTFVGMIVHLGTYLTQYIARLPQESIWKEILSYVSFLDLWFNALDGMLAPRYLLFHLSATVFFLFLSVKVLEARKWS
jgi:ABC-type transport system involved in multi-copper enzyme maturation permease subunit